MAFDHRPIGIGDGVAEKVASWAAGRLSLAPQNPSARPPGSRCFCCQAIATTSTRRPLCRSFSQWFRRVARVLVTLLIVKSP